LKPGDIVTWNSSSTFGYASNGAPLNFATASNNQGAKSGSSKDDVDAVTVGSLSSPDGTQRKLCTVIGYARHKIWLQIHGSGVIFGCSYDSIHSAIHSETVQVLQSAAPNDNENLTAYTMLLAREGEQEEGTNHQKLKGSYLPDLIDSKSTEESVSEEKMGVEFPLNSNYVEKPRWSLELDELLVQWLELKAGAMGMHPLLLPYDCSLSPSSGSTSVSMSPYESVSAMKAIDTALKSLERNRGSGRVIVGRSSTEQWTVIEEFIHKFSPLCVFSDRELRNR